MYFDPSWAPDSSRIAFRGDDFVGFGIYVADVDGRNVQQLTRHAGCTTWSPDGTKIAFSSFLSDSFGIHVMDTNGNDVQQLSRKPVTSVAWSPDGTRIAFTSIRDADNVTRPRSVLDRWVGKDSNICVIDVDGRNAQTLTGVEGACSTLAWSPDSNQIAFASNHYETGGIFVMDADGENVRRLTQHQLSLRRRPGREKDQYRGEHSLAPNLWHKVWLKGFCLYQRSPGLVSIGPERSRRRRWARGFEALRAHVAEEGHPDIPSDYVTPTGYRLGLWMKTQHLLFKRGELPLKDVKQLATVPALGLGELARVPWQYELFQAKDGRRFIWALCQSLSFSNLAWFSERQRGEYLEFSNGYGMFALDAHGEAPVSQTDKAGGLRSPDGTRIVSLASVPRRELLQKSPIEFRTSDIAVWFVRRHGEAPTVCPRTIVDGVTHRWNARRLTNHPGTGWPGFTLPAWSPDSSRIVFEHWRGGARSNTALFIMDRFHGNAQKLTANGRCPSWSPDGTRIAFMSAQTGSGFDISVADVNDRNIHVSTGDDSSYNPIWSPDSSRIAFTRNFQGLYVMDAENGNVRCLSGEPISPDPSYRPEWSTDGSQIKFATWHGGRDGTDISCVVDLDGGNKQRWIDIPEESRHQAWQQPVRPPSTRHVFVRASDNVGTVHIHITGTDVGERIYGMPIQHLMGISGKALVPVWSPDDSHMAVSDEIGSSRDIYLLDANGNVILRFGQFEALDSFNSFN